MLLKPLTVAAGLLAVPATQAFLIPPEVSDADIEIASTIESVGPQITESHVVDVECPGCPILVTGRRGKDVQLQIDRPSHLELTFSVDHQTDHDRLLVNGLELYPSHNPLREILVAPQVVDHREKKDKRHNREHRKRPHRLPQPQKLGFGVQVGQPKKDTDGQFELVEIELQIIEVGVAFVDGIPSVKVKVIKDGEGRLLMSQIEKGEPKHLLEVPKGGAEECTTMLCEYMAALRAKLKSVKGFGHCHGGAMKGSAPGGNVAHPHRPSGDHWRAPYQERRWGMLFKYIASHILLPVLIGIVAGVSVSL